MNKQAIIIIGVVTLVVMVGVFMFYEKKEPPRPNAVATEVRPFDQRAPHTCDENFIFFITDTDRGVGNSVTCQPFKKSDVTDVSPSDEYVITCDANYEVSFDLDTEANPIEGTCKGKEKL